MMSGNRWDADDLAQETFVRVFRGIRSFHGGSALTTWIYRIVHNLCLDDAKRRYAQNNPDGHLGKAHEGGAHYLTRHQLKRFYR